MSNRDEMVTLTIKEQARDKIHVWFGSKSNHIHTCLEVLTNASDEISNNFDKISDGLDVGVINVELSDDCKTISVEDTGRGLKLGNKTNGKPNYELYFETLFSSTNYDNISSKKITGGTNGVAQVILCQTSEDFMAEAWYDGHYYKINYHEGEMIGGLQKEKCSDKKHGTKITFTSSDEVFTTTIFDAMAVSDLCKKLAGVNNLLRVVFKHKGVETIYQYDSYVSYMEEIVSNNISDTIAFPIKEFQEKSGERNSVECVLSLSTEPVQQTFLNYIHLKEHGTIYDGVISGLRVFLQRHIENKKTRLSNQDIEMSFNILCVAMSTNVEYESQMKFSTAKQLYRTLTSDYIIENMEIFKAENPQEFDKILKHLQQINTFNTRNEKSIKNIKKKLSEKSDTFTNRIESLVDCRKHGDGTELFICEGKSALSSVIASRNADNQAAIAIRGKTLSVLKASVEQIFNNQVILDIIKVLGCNVRINQNKSKIDVDFDIDNLRYGKIIITTDADPDGDAITCLLTTTFYRLMPELLRQGKVYIAKTPLFEITTKDGRLIYAFSDRERDEVVKNNKVVKVQRNKGLISN